MTARHDMPFSVALPDGRLLIGGGCSSGSGIGQSANVDAYDPASHAFSAFSSLSTARTLSRAVAIGDVVIASGNWYSSDGIEMWSAEADKFSYVKQTSQPRHNPYMLRSSADNAIIFGATDNYGDKLPETIVDRYQGDDFVPALFETWKPLVIGSNWRAKDCFIGDEATGDYSYLIMVNDRESDNRNRGGVPALVKGEEFSLLPVDYEIPAACEFGDIYFSGPVVVDRSKKTGYALGYNGDESNAVYYILKIEYADALNGGKAKLTMYYSDVLEPFGGLYQGGIALMSDGRLMAAGGISNSNYSPYSTVYAFKPF